MVVGGLPFICRSALWAPKELAKFTPLPLYNPLPKWSMNNPGYPGDDNDPESFQGPLRQL